MSAGDWIVSWSSLNPKVATVNARGMITAKKQGKAWIQVTLASGIVLKAQVKVQKKQVKKTPGGKPGFVIYHTNYSLLIDPDIRNIQQVK